ncbi:hypothetical protein [Pinirhizobacter soli]|uniref:hypothetical protein n=1 Tax=Pinirhizobacter soli TaxID=2786953 RepID=UPI00202A6F5F|nr:hypothetical protein [Pinirhizobacter soli]
MGRRRSSDGGFVLLVIGGFILWALSRILDVTGWIVPLAVVLGIAVLVALRNDARRRARIAALRARYPEDVVQRILAGHIWQGQSAEQLIDTLGQPVEVDRKVLKTMRREVWKYRRISAQRFALRITVEDGYVMGWDKKA